MLTAAEPTGPLMTKDHWSSDISPACLKILQHNSRLKTSLCFSNKPLDTLLYIVNVMASMRILSLVLRSELLVDISITLLNI